MRPSLAPGLPKLLEGGTFGKETNEPLQQQAVVAAVLPGDQPGRGAGSRSESCSAFPDRPGAGKQAGREHPPGKPRAAARPSPRGSGRPGKPAPRRRRSLTPEPRAPTPDPRGWAAGRRGRAAAGRAVRQAAGTGLPPHEWENLPPSPGPTRGRARTEKEKRDGAAGELRSRSPAQTLGAWQSRLRKIKGEEDFSSFCAPTECPTPRYFTHTH